MDKNTLAGLLVVGLILLGFSWWNGEQNKKYAEQRRVADSIALASMPEPVAEGPVAEVAEDKTGTGDSLRRVRIGDILADAEIAAPQELTFSNAVMDVKFDTRGARVDNVVLKDYKKYGSDEPVTMYEDGSSHFGMQFWLAGDQFIDTSDYTFEFAGEEAMEGGRRIIFELPVDSAGRVRYIYTMFDDDYMMDFDVQFVDMEGRLSNRMSSLMFDWGLTTQQQEKGFTNENNYSYLAWNTPGERKPDESGKRKDDSATETVTGNVQWIAMKQQFFTTTFVSRGNFQNPELTYETFKPGSGLIKRYTAQANVAYNRSQADYGFRIYFGPVEYRRLKSYDMGMERLVGLGWSFARWVNVWLVIPVFNFLMRHIESMGLIILLLTVMIRLIILPLTYKSYEWAGFDTDIDDDPVYTKFVTTEWTPGNPYWTNK